jgi:hypothetical protein
LWAILLAIHVPTVEICKEQERRILAFLVLLDIDKMVTSDILQNLDTSNGRTNVNAIQTFSLV